MIIKDQSLLDITPCKEELEKYLDKWNNSLDNPYKFNDKVLSQIKEKYPNNTHKTGVYIKANLLNSMYNTNIHKIDKVADAIFKHRKKLNDYFSKNNLSKEEKAKAIKIVSYGHKIKTKNDEEYCFYSFATKYCNLHNKNFPIFDKFVEKILKHYIKTNQNLKIKCKNLNFKDYINYIDVIESFKSEYKLNEYNNKQIDIYLWQKSKECFENKSKNK